MTGYQSKRAMARDKLNDDDDTQVYGDALTIAYQSGYYDGKKAAQPVQNHVEDNLTMVDMASLIACRDRLDAQPVPARSPERLDYLDALARQYPKRHFR